MAASTGESMEANEDIPGEAIVTAPFYNIHPYLSQGNMTDRRGRGFNLLLDQTNSGFLFKRGGNIGRRAPVEKGTEV